MPNETVIVVGGGIGGLAAALALSKRGYKVLVIERAARFEEVGAGIQLGPNAFHALDQLPMRDLARVAICSSVALPI